MGTSDSPSFSFPDLRCLEDEFSLSEKEDPYADLTSSSSSCSISEIDDEYFQALIERETLFDSNHFTSKDVSTSSWLKSARLEAIKWILNTREFFGFQFSTAYLSLAYFDHFLSRRSIDEGKLWAVQLLSIACVSLAAKMEEMKAPVLTQFQTDDDDYKFEWSSIQRMELLVLSHLQWKMHLITPFSYLHYFITKLCVDFRDCSLQDFVSMAVDYILTITREVNLVEIRPCVVAMAAILAADDDQLTRKAMETKMSSISSWNSILKEQVCRCYDLMVKMKKVNNCTPESEKCGDCSFSSSLAVKTGAGFKRRLSFTISNKECLRPYRRVRRS
ncbi:cyclin-D5-1-like [Impatiens glandulifera]|uniref:cyclin-D5-1-like n=1 Tax=Impatiens glandulifera TaxID=253017 RepID=UPI001FB0A1BE|nr:cyclin-D5-1-like [Impatiens glandulifera]